MPAILARQSTALNHLDRNFTIQAELPRPKHDAHAAASQFLQQFVIANLCWQCQASPSRSGAVARDRFVMDGPGRISHQDRAPQASQLVGQIGMFGADPIKVDNLAAANSIGHFGKNVGQSLFAGTACRFNIR